MFDILGFRCMCVRVYAYANVFLILGCLICLHFDVCVCMCLCPYMCVFLICESIIYLYSVVCVCTYMYVCVSLILGSLIYIHPDVYMCARVCIRKCFPNPWMFNILIFRCTCVFACVLMHVFYSYLDL